jgi:hypothetical protein
MSGLRCRLALLAGILFSAACGCNVLNLGPAGSQSATRDSVAGAPGKHSYRIAPYVFLADFDIPRNAPVFRELAGLRDQVTRELRLPAINSIVQVYLFEDRQHYESFMQAKYPKLPKRRAFFVAQPRRLGGTEDLLVYTYWGDRIQQDLRHELTHALLHGVLKDVPLWLDEGIAEFFEVPSVSNGTNQQHLEQLRRGGEPKPNLARLEQISEVEQMTPADYREAWAWVHLMLRSTPKARDVLVAYLQELRSNPQPGPLRPRLATAFLSLDEALDRHLAGVAAKNPMPESVRR